MKSSNEYAQAFGRLYSAIPKSVFAAVAFSYANISCGEDGHESDNSNETVRRFLNEWKILHENGIVPQKPPSVFMTAKAIADADGQTWPCTSCGKSHKQFEACFAITKEEVQ